ncbi:MAG: DNA polymerase IV [Gammaproteobacteria bacterium]|nr:DNA polymerase IV [Gammaproteobacteria bacterium]
MSDHRAILHVDMDAFYASVEQFDNPELAGQPVVVGGTGGRGVVAAASYEVRRFGVHSAMPMREAMQRCPHAIVIRPRMKRYREVSHQVFEIFGEFTDLVEGLSLDEAFLDVTGSKGLFGSAEAMAQEIKNRIRVRTGLTASVGVSYNKLLAKLASEMNKPDGLAVIRPAEVTMILDPMPVRRLHGIGAKTAVRLEQQGIHTLGQLRRAPESVLWPLFRRETREMRERASGIDDRPVVSDAPEKQISSEETFDVDIKDHEELRQRLAQLADRTAERLRSRQLKAGMISIKVRRRDFETYTRQRSFRPPTQETRLVVQVATELLDHWLDEQPRAAVRLLGVGVSDLAPAQQLDLFTTRESVESGKLDETLDRIRGKYGTEAVKRGSD